MHISEILYRVCPLPEASAKLLACKFTEFKLAKNDTLFKADRVERYMCFIKQGIVRAYATLGQQDITFWFGWEGDPVLSMNSYVSQHKGYENVALLSDCTFYRIDMHDLIALFKTDIHIANWGRKFAEQELLKTEERLISRQVSTATERYKALLINTPSLIQRVPLGYIASYLGITQVSLSRIRATIK